MIDKIIKQIEDEIIMEMCNAKNLYENHQIKEFKEIISYAEKHIIVLKQLTEFM